MKKVYPKIATISLAFAAARSMLYIVLTLWTFIFHWNTLPSKKLMKQDVPKLVLGFFVKENFWSVVFILDFTILNVCITFIRTHTHTHTHTHKHTHIWNFFKSLFWTFHVILSVLTWKCLKNFKNKASFMRKQSWIILKCILFYEIRK